MKTKTKNLYMHKIVRSVYGQLFDEAFDYSFRTYSLYSESLDDYIKKKAPSLRRRAMYHTITVNLFVASILYLTLAINPDGIKYLGAPLTFILLDDFVGQIGYFVCSIKLIIVTLLRLCIAHNESRFQYFIMDLYYAMKVENPDLNYNKAFHKALQQVINRIEFNPKFFLLANLWIAIITKILYQSYQPYILLIVWVYAYLNNGSGPHMFMIIVNVAVSALWANTLKDMTVIGIPILVFKSCQTM